MMEILKPGARIAVVGGGVAGIVSAYLLQQKYAVTLFEADSRLGGHTNTVTIDAGVDKGTEVDTGFIVLNNKTYPLFTRFLARLEVPIRWSDMSLSYENLQSGFCYAGTTLNGLFAQRKNLFSPSFHHLLREIVRFCGDGRQRLSENSNLENSDFGSMTLGEFLETGKYSNLMRDHYLLPMGAAIWSAPFSEVLAFPAISFLRFFYNHGLLSFRNRPRWQTVVGGSHQYVKAFLGAFSGDVRLNEPIAGVENGETKAILRLSNGGSEEYDSVVLATHADQTFKMLRDADSVESELLGTWRYQENQTILHTDISQLPKNKRAWASWNCIGESGQGLDSKITVTYHMNRLQGLDTEEEYCVTLNPIRPIARNRIIKEFVYHHPMFDSAAISSQSRLSELQGRNRRFYCGSYFGYGFHEDAVRSAVNLGELLQVTL